VRFSLSFCLFNTFFFNRFAEIIFRLNEVIVDYMIEDKYGRAFWKAHFLQDQPVHPPFSPHFVF